MMPSVAVCERARASKDRRFDGLFFIAVKTTGIYCRPVCPAPTVKSRNLIYYPTAAAASAAGYRPCLRCRPELSPEVRANGNEDALHRALAMIADGSLEEATIERLASHLQLSSRHLRRLFVEHTGATPVVVNATRRLLLAKQLLTETTLPITEIAFASGFKSIRRFNTAFRNSCRMTPTQLRHRASVRRLQLESEIQLRLAYRPPMKFDFMLQFLAAHAIPQFERVTRSSYERCIDADQWIRVINHPHVAELHLQMPLIDPRKIPDVVQRVRRLFDLDSDLDSAKAVLSRDPLLGARIRKKGMLRVPGCWDGSEILMQAAKNQPDLLRRLSGAVEQGQIHFRRGQLLDEFVDQLCVFGLSKSAAHYAAMRALNHPDAFPGHHPHSEAWRPWRAYAWMLLQDSPQSRKD